jgi:hypothetical protein
MPITRLDNLLNSAQGTSLDKVIRRARDMDDLTTRLRRSLEPEMAAQLLGANLRDDGQLVLICGSSAWAAKLRFESETLLDVARQGGAHATSCRVRVGS